MAQQRKNKKTIIDKNILDSTESLNYKMDSAFGANCEMQFINSVSSTPT